MLDILERISLLVKTRVITLEYTYELFSTLYAACLENEDKQITIVYENESKFYSHVKQIAIWCDKYYKNDRWFMFRYHYCRFLL